MSAFDQFDACRNILESLLTGVCVVDMQKKILFWSDGAERITGHLRHEVIGRSCVDRSLLHCQQPGCEFCSEECPLARAIKTAHPVEASGFLHHKSGYEVPVRIRAVPVHNPHGSIIGAVETFDELEQIDVNHGEKALPGSVDDVTGLATQAQMKSHLREALAAFTQRQVAFGVLRFRLQGLEHFRAAFGPDAASHSGASRSGRNLGQRTRRAFFHQRAIHYQTSQGSRTRRAYHAQPRRAVAPLPSGGRSPSGGF